MVVSLTIIPVLAARFLGRRPMPTTGPIYNLLADRYEGLLQARASIPAGRRSSWPLLASIPAGWLCQHLETGFMPEMDEGAFVLDYDMPVGTSLTQTDRVMRRVEDGASAKRRISPATSAGPGPSSGSSPRSPTPVTSWSASSPPATPADERDCSTPSARN